MRKKKYKFWLLLIVQKKSDQLSLSLTLFQTYSQKRSLEQDRPNYIKGWKKIYIKRMHKSYFFAKSFKCTKFLMKKEFYDWQAQLKRIKGPKTIDLPLPPHLQVSISKQSYYQQLFFLFGRKNSLIREAAKKGGINGCATKEKRTFFFNVRKKVPMATKPRGEGG